MGNLFGVDNKVSTAFSARSGNYIPGPGDPHPAFGGGGAYNGNPGNAWGQYPAWTQQPAVGSSSTSSIGSSVNWFK